MPGFTPNDDRAAVYATNRPELLRYPTDGARLRNEHLKKKWLFEAADGG
jgi:hypothetical protein